MVTYLQTHYLRNKTSRDGRVDMLRDFGTGHTLVYRRRHPSPPFILYCVHLCAVVYMCVVTDMWV